MNEKFDLKVTITDQGEELDQKAIHQMLKVSVLKLVLQAMGGKLTVHSEVQGTTFTVTLPFNS